MKARQLQLSLENGSVCRTAKLRQRKRGRRSQWFDLMRQVAETPSAEETAQVEAEPAFQVQRQGRDLADRAETDLLF